MSRRVSWSRGALERRCVRYRDLVPCIDAFVDRRIPGREGNENFAVIGPGVAEAANQFVHVTIPHGFNIGGARQAPGTVNSQHSHVSAEVFVVHEGLFRFHFGPDREDGSVALGAGDTISVPVGVFRGFENIGSGSGYLFAVLGGDDPGPVTWAPSVLDAARGTGLVLTEDGRLIDTAAGGRLPPGSRIARPLTAEELSAFRRMTAEEALGCVSRDGDLRPDRGSPLAAPGVADLPVLGSTAGGGLGEPPGFHMRRIRIDPGAGVPAHDRSEDEVLFVHRGAVVIAWDGGRLELGAGDHLTLPGDLPRSWRNAGAARADVVVVRRGDDTTDPARPAA